MKIEIKENTAMKSALSVKLGVVVVFDDFDFIE
jgi:hypothetical protein